METEAPAKPVEPAVAKPASPAIPSRATTSITQGGWILQVGSFSQQANALSLRDRLKKSGYQASVKDVKAAGGTIHRVLVGPVSDRPSAEKLRNKLASEQKLTAMVLENK
jgi:DedD protein